MKRKRSAINGQKFSTKLGGNLSLVAKKKNVMFSGMGVGLKQ